MGAAMFIPDLQYSKPAKQQEHKERDKRFAWDDLNWLQLVFVTSYWIMATVLHRGWADALVPLNCVLALPMLLATLWLIKKAIQNIRHNHSWRSVLPATLLLATLLITAIFPTKAGWILQKNQSSLEVIANQANELDSYDEWKNLRRLIWRVPDITDWWFARKRNPFDSEPDVICLTMRTGSTVGLVHVSTGNLAHCDREWAWAKRINDYWFETSDSLALWYLQPNNTLLKLGDILDIMAGGIGAMG